MGLLLRGTTYVSSFGLQQFVVCVRVKPVDVDVCLRVSVSNRQTECKSVEPPRNFTKRMSLRYTKSLDKNRLSFSLPSSTVVIEKYLFPDEDRDTYNSLWFSSNASRSNKYSPPDVTNEERVVYHKNDL